MKNIRFLVALASAVLVIGGFSASLAQSQTPLGHVSEEEMMEMNSTAETEWRLPGGGVGCDGACPPGLRCCGSNFSPEPI